jgi:hypothetical protein
VETNSRLPNSNNITVRKSSSSNSDVLFTISLAPGTAPSILPDSPEQMRTRTHLLDTPDFRFMSDDTVTRPSPMAAFLSVSCEDRSIIPDGNSPPVDASPLLGSCTLLRHPLHLNQKLLPAKASRSLSNSCAALGQFQRSDDSFPPEDEENLFDFKYDRSVATPPPPFYADNHNTMESIQDIGGFIEGVTHTTSNSNSSNNIDSSSSSNDDSGVHMMSMEISDGMARGASATGDGAASSLLWGPARTMGNELCGYGYSPDGENLLFPPSSLNYSSSAAAVTGSASQNSGWNPIDPLNNTSPSRTDDEWRGTTAEDRMNSSSYEAAMVKCAGSTARQLSYIEAGGTGGAQGGGDRSHMGGSSSSTDTDEELNSVLFPSSSASSTPSRAHAQTGQAQQDIPPADWCTPVRSAEEMAAAAVGDDGLSTPVHSWINCAQQFIGFGGGNMHSRTSCGPNTRSDNDQDDGQSLTRFLFSPVDVISVGDGENMCSGEPPDCSLFADAAGSRHHSVSSASSFVLTALSPVTAIAAPLTLSVSDRSGDMGTAGAGLVSPGQAVPVPSSPFVSSGCLASEVEFTVKTKPRD